MENTSLPQTIRVNAAQILTPTITVREVKVDGKSMTQKTFRQIPEEPIIDTSTYTLKGVPWGFINYFWVDNKDQKGKNTKHILWQKGEELRRCFINGYYNDEFGWCLELDNVSEWNILRTFYNEDDFKNDTMLIKAEINGGTTIYKQQIETLLKKYGSGIPVLPVYKIENVQEILSQFLESYKKSLSEWAKYTPGSFIRDHIFTFNGVNKRMAGHYFDYLHNETDYSDYVNNTKNLLVKCIKEAYLFYTNNHLAYLNRLVDSVHNAACQLFI